MHIIYMKAMFIYKVYFDHVEQKKRLMNLFAVSAAFVSFPEKIAKSASLVIMNLSSQLEESHKLTLAYIVQ